ncbi:MAG: hypothetical protein M1820_007910, partial [Bogoriella megaspora]
MDNYGQGSSHWLSPNSAVPIPLYNGLPSTTLEPHNQSQASSHNNVPTFTRRRVSDSTSTQISSHSGPSTTNSRVPRFERKSRDRFQSDLTVTRAVQESDALRSCTIAERKRRLTAPDSPGRRGNGVGNESTRREDYVGLNTAYTSNICGDRLSFGNNNMMANNPRDNNESRAVMQRQDPQTPGSRNTPIDLTHSSPATGNTPLPPRRRNSRPHGSPQDSDIVLPRWQPDSEVSECPVCGTMFSFFYRKHHCRKCGRVVCSNCSPHRVTIPRQFIVHPPESSTSTGSQAYVDLTGGQNELTNNSPPYNSFNPGQGRRDSYSHSPFVSGSSGGETVRICNPCVPDPNFSPPPQQSHAYTPFPNFGSSSQLTPAQRQALELHPSQAPNITSRPTEGNTQSGSPRPVFPADTARLMQGMTGAQQQHRQLQAMLLHQRLEAARTQQQQQHQLNMASGLPQGQNPGYPHFNRRHTLQQQVPHNFPQGNSSAHNPFHGRRTSNPAFASQQQLPPGLPPGFLPDLQNNSTTPVNFNAPLPPVPPSFSGTHPHPIPSSHYSSHHTAPHTSRRPEIPEEDECPVCGLELPPKGPNGDETAREQHIAQCIQDHSFGEASPARENTVSAPPAASSLSAAAEGSSLPRSHHDARITDSRASGQEQLFHASGSSMSTSTPRSSTYQGLHTPTASTSVPSAIASGSGSRPRRQTVNRMLVYTATEKDCVDANGEALECVICFEEFEEGDEMGRLECLCKFHR